MERGPEEAAARAAGWASRWSRRLAKAHGTQSVCLQAAICTQSAASAEKRPHAKRNCIGRGPRRASRRGRRLATKRGDPSSERAEANWFKFNLFKFNFFGGNRSDWLAVLQPPADVSSCPLTSHPGKQTRTISTRCKRKPSEETPSGLATRSSRSHSCGGWHACLLAGVPRLYCWSGLSRRPTRPSAKEKCWLPGAQAERWFTHPPPHHHA